jgi:hypothetical protein
MLPNVAGEARPSRQILAYSLVLAPLSASRPGLLGFAGAAYGASRWRLGAGFVWYASRLWRGTTRPGDMRAPRAVFGFRSSISSRSSRRAAVRMAAHEGRQPRAEQPGRARTCAPLACVIVPSSSAWSACSPMRPCRSTTCSAGDRLRRHHAASPSNPTGRVLDRPSRCASTPTSRRPALGFSRPHPQTHQDRRERTGLLHARQPVGPRRPSAPPPSTSRRTGRRLLQQDRVLLLHRADAAAGRDARDAGRLLRRSRDRRRRRTAQTIKTITLSYTFFPVESAAGRPRPWRPRRRI